MLVGTACQLYLGAGNQRTAKGASGNGPSQKSSKSVKSRPECTDIARFLRLRLRHPLWGRFRGAAPRASPGFARGDSRGFCEGGGGSPRGEGGVSRGSRGFGGGGVLRGSQGSRSTVGPSQKSSKSVKSRPECTDIARFLRLRLRIPLQAGNHCDYQHSGGSCELSPLHVGSPWATALAKFDCGWIMFGRVASCWVHVEGVRYDLCGLVVGTM